MHLQSELENYKLQVELLQEKLHRSENNRQELEVQLEQIMKKRSEHETALRSRSQRKYQQFLDEQKKRNERNHKLVEVLERIDRQAAALAARSERLKMMKLQYEFYFGKLAQSYSLKSVQHIRGVPFLPIQKTSNSYARENSDNDVQEKNYSRSFNTPTSQFQPVPIPVVVPIPNDQNHLNSSWAFATTPSGVLISLSNNTHLPSGGVANRNQNEASFGEDYLKFPIGYLQSPTGLPESHQQQNNLSKETHAKSFSFKPPFESEGKCAPFSPDIKRNEQLSNLTQADTNQKVLSFSGKKTVGYEALDSNKKEREDVNGHDPVNIRNFRTPNMSKSDSLMPRQNFKVDILSNISPNNNFQQKAENRREEHRGNKSNAIDFRTDGDDYIKYIKEMRETYEKNVPTPINSPPQEQGIDNITTTLQVQKIDETTVKDDEKINDIEDNQKNTSSAFPSLGGKCSMESIGDEALTKKSLENKTTENTSNVVASIIDPTRDTEQITLFNGTKNSRDESIEASNRTTAIIDGGSKNVDNSENTPSETNYQPMHFDKKEKMSIESIETAIYGELLPQPENLTPTNILDIHPIEDDRNEEDIKYARKLKQYEYVCDNSKTDTYEPKTNPVAELKEYPIDTEMIADSSSRETDTVQETYKNRNNNETHEINEQNYDYAGVTQEYMDSIHEEPPLQDYTFTEDAHQPQTENYVNDYQNYDTTQYETNYDPNAYQYECNQQYDDSNQAQYASEMYQQDYSQDSYTQEYVNYDQNASSDMDVSNQGYVEQPEKSLNDEKMTPTSLEQKLEEIEPELESSMQHTPNETNDDSLAKKQNTPTSILSTEKHTDISTKKKKRVNFVDSETDDSSTLPKPDAGSNESDFDFSEK